MIGILFVLLRFILQQTCDEELREEYIMEHL